jgi:hypothetical protein
MYKNYLYGLKKSLPVMLDFCRLPLLRGCGKFCWHERGAVGIYVPFRFRWRLSDNGGTDAHGRFGGAYNYSRHFYNQSSDIIMIPVCSEIKKIILLFSGYSPPSA